MVQQTLFDMADDFEFAPSEPFWRCEECGAEDKATPLPLDRAKYYANPKPRKCKKCKSIGCVPVGF